MCDGSTRFIKSTISQPAYHALGTWAGGEVISADSYDVKAGAVVLADGWRRMRVASTNQKLETP